VGRIKYCQVIRGENNIISTISRELKRKKKTHSGIFIVPNTKNPSIHPLNVVMIMTSHERDH
jgi:hypothetical protein